MFAALLLLEKLNVAINSVRQFGNTKWPLNVPMITESTTIFRTSLIWIDCNVVP